MSLYELEAQRQEQGLKEYDLSIKLRSLIRSCPELTTHEKDLLTEDLQKNGFSYFVKTVHAEERQAIERGISRKGLPYFLK